MGKVTTPYPIEREKYWRKIGSTHWTVLSGDEGFGGGRFNFIWHMAGERSGAASVTARVF